MDALWFSVGFAAGMGSGVGVGNVTGAKTSKEQIKASLSALIDSGEITIQGRDGETISPEEFVAKVLPGS